jgi:hypothetical protein
MAIAYVGQGETTAVSSTTVTVTVDCGAGADFIAVGACHYAANAITAMTIGGVDCLSQTLFAPSINNRIFYDVGSFSGNVDCVFTWAGTASCMGGGVSYSGVDQTTPFDGSQTNSTNDALTELVTVTSATGNAVLLGLLWSEDPNTSITITAAGSGSPTLRQELYSSRQAVAFADASGAASVEGGFTVTRQPEYTFDVVGVNLIAATGGGGSINFDEDYQLILPVAAAW